MKLTNSNNYSYKRKNVKNYDTGPCVRNHLHPSLISSGKAGLGKAGALGKARALGKAGALGKARAFQGETL